MTDDLNFEESGDPLGPDPVVPPEWFLKYLRSALGLPIFSVPKPFETWMIDRVASSGFDVPISQIVGFSQYVAQTAFVATTETTASTSYTNLTTTGPTLSGLGNGLYLIFHGCEAKEDVGGFGALMSYSVNGAAASDTVLCENANTEFASVSRITTVSLSAGANEIVAKYRAGGAATASFASRFLIALRISNL